jgi:hypothetical protein
MRRTLLLLPLLLLAACGGGGGAPADDAASLVPPTALAFVTVDTDFSSSQLKSVQSVLDKFPIKPRVVAQLKSSLRRAGVNPDALKSSVGSQVDLAVLNVGGETNAVGFAQPSDEKKFEQQLAAGGGTTLHTTISGWTVFAEKQSFLDAVKKRTGNLADEQSYKDAQSSLPSDAIARAYVSPAAIDQGVALSGVGTSLPLNTKGARWVTAALSSAKDALKLEVHAKGVAENATQTSSDLAAQIPSGSIVALSVVGGSKAAGGTSTQALKQAQTFVPFDLSGISNLLGGETIAYVRAGLPIPEVTVASKPKDVQKALKTIGSLVASLGPPSSGSSTVTVDGVVLKKVDLGSVAIFYGAFDGELVVSDSQNAVEELRSKGDKLTGDSVFKEAKDGAGLPEVGEGFVFVDLKDAVPAAEGLAKLANQTIPPEIDANLRPLRSLLVYASRDAGVQSFVAFVQTS